MSEDRNSVPFPEFFAAVERRLAREFPGRWPSFQVEVCGKIVELRFASAPDAEYASRGLRGRIVQTGQTPHAVFKYWKDRCAEYIGEENVAIRWNKRDNSGFIANYIRKGFIGGDYREMVFYCCDDSQSGNTMLFMHALHMVFYQWALSEGMMMFHAAAVGAEGRGVLIAGRSGAGKSTLSTACMLTGMDVVGDDYVILTGTGTYRAMPLYSSVCLNPNMYEKLKPDMRTIEIASGGKLALDASAYLCPTSMEIKCLLALVQVRNEVPKITDVPSGSVITRLVHSTLQQAGFDRDVERVRQMTARLIGLPAYELCQCKDPRKDAEFLRQFILKEL